MPCVHVKCWSYDSHFRTRVKVGGHGLKLVVGKKFKGCHV
jgi:hypothetical protein